MQELVQAIRRRSALLFVGAGVSIHYLPQGPANAPAPSPISANTVVTADRLMVSEGGSRIDVVLRVTAGNQDIGPVSVFWMVGPPEDKQPWEAPRYVARAQKLDSLPANGTVARATTWATR